MNLTRRRLVVAGCAAGALAAAPARADAWPSRPISLVIGFAAGSSTDVASRIVAEQVGAALGQRIVIETKPGAASRIAAEAVARSPKDGYTLFVGTVANVINDSLNPGSATFSRDLAPVALFGSTPTILAVPASLPARSVAELLAYARSRPDGLTYGSPGNGTAPHLAGEMFAQLAGVKLTHVPYSGSAQAVTDLLGGRIDMMFVPASSALAQVRSGALRALASTGRERTSVAADLPTVAEAGLEGFDTNIWFGVMAPAGTPDEVVDKLALAIKAAVASEPVRTAFATQMVDPLGGGPKEFREWVASETRKWDGVIGRAGLARK